MPLQAELPKEILEMPADRLAGRIAQLKARLGRDLVILAHHYQADEIVAAADFVGDSLKLSQQAAARKDARFIVFCGVHFMAESACILASPDQAVCLPNLQAGCAMADMADDLAVQAAMDELDQAGRGRVVPVAYVNSSAAVKAIAGRSGGACCTSSNARNVFQWAFAPESAGGAGGDVILALPDQYLALNTAVAMGFSSADCAIYDYEQLRGGLAADQVRDCRFILWKGFCHVHQMFSPADIKRIRAARPDIKVIVHPECPREIVEMADASGSTEQIIQAVASAPAGSSWAIGTESHMIHRLARKHPDKFICVLSGRDPVCHQMARIDLRHLLWTLENLAEENVVNRIAVPSEVADDARLALERMLAIKPSNGITPAGG
ncbi:MAG: quinolinate synthase NadA [Planctomycetes bacterium]|nr:quinolinate synthase NadA [Planctomycetota bacterium]